MRNTNTKAIYPYVGSPGLLVSGGGVMKRLRVIALAFCVVAACLVVYVLYTRQHGALGLEESLSIASDAYIYGYPLVTMDMTRKQMCNVATPDADHAPMGQLIKMRTYPTADFRTAAGPNADTLYTMVWLDVSIEPWVFSIPDMGDRFYIMPMLSGYNEVFQVSGSRATGGKAQKYVITGPGWSGKLPEGLAEVKSPTGLVWICGRIYCTGTPEDYKATHAVQNEYSVVPLSSYGKSYEPLPGEVDANFDMKTSVRKQVDDMDIYTFFNYLAKLLKTNPPKAEDAPLVSRMAKIGLVPGQDFDPSKLNLLDKEAIRAIPKTSLLKMAHRLKEVKTVNGWLYFTKEAGSYGTDYLLRAAVTLIGPAGNLPQDAIYPLSEKDENDKEYNGAEHNYVIHFDKGQAPPVKGFWSLTMYDKDLFFVPNALNRYNLSQRNKFNTNADGSVDLYLQAESPGKDKEANWLPAPKGKFIPMLRLYWPTDQPPSILDSTWKPPPLRVAN